MQFLVVMLREGLTFNLRIPIIITFIVYTYLDPFLLFLQSTHLKLDPFYYFESHITVCLFSCKS